MCVCVRARVCMCVMVHPQLTGANSFLAFSVYKNRQFSCMDGN